MRLVRFGLASLLPSTLTSFILMSCLAGDPDAATEPVDSVVDPVSGCVTDVIRTVPANNPSVVDRPVNVGFGISRVARMLCSSSCVKQKECPIKGDWVTTCLQWAPDCTNPTLMPQGFIDFASASEAGAGQMYRENNEGPSWHYLGCGPQAVMNVLNYYGVDKPIDQVYSMMNTIYIKSDSIATFPDDVRDGLQAMLNAYGDGAFTVIRRSGVDDMLGLLRGQVANGRPAILLVNGGNHYYTVLAVAGSDVYVIDYPTTSNPGPQTNSGRWVHFNDLDLTISPFAQAGAALVAGVGGWKDNTVITVERTGPKPPAPPPPFVPCVTGKTGARGCLNQLIKFSVGNSNVVGGGLGGQVSQGIYDSSFYNRKFDFMPVSNGWRIQQHGVNLCLRAGVAPDNKIYTDDCSTSCVQGGVDTCVWQFGTNNDPYSGYTYLRNVNYAGGNTCLASDFGGTYTTTSSGPRLQTCGAPLPQNNPAKYDVYIDYAP